MVTISVQTNKHGGGTAQKHNAFAETVRRHRQNLKPGWVASNDLQLENRISLFLRR